MTNHGVRWRNRLRRQLWWLVAAPVLLIAAYAVVARQLMMLVPDYRQDLEALIEQRLGFPIVIDQLSGDMDGLTPRFQVRGLTLPDADGEPSLRLDQVSVSVNVLATLWHRQPYLRELRIQGVDVHLVRDPDGGIRLRGFEALHRDGDDNLADSLRTLYRQDRILVEDARFSLDWPGLPPLAASSLTLAMVNEGGEHALSARVEARDRPFSVDARLLVDGDPLSLAELNARGYLDVHGERLQEWLPEARDWPLDLAALNGQVRAWGRIENGAPRAGQVRLTAPEATLTDGDGQWPLSDLRLDAQWRRDGDGDGENQLSVTSLTGETPAGAVSPGPVALRWRRQDDQYHWRFKGDDLAIHALTRQLAEWPFALPEGLDTVRDRLREHEPRGVLEAVYLDGVDGRVAHLQARFAGLASDALDRVPGISGLTGWLAGTPDGGVARLDGEPLQLTVPRLYGHPLSAAFNGPLRWRSEADHWWVESGVLRAANADARGLAMLRVDGGAAYPVPELRLLADVFDGNGARAAHYIPMEKLKDPLGDWLAQAFQGGHLDHGRFLYQGPVKIDPDRQQDRTFQMRFQARDVVLSFLPDWPAATGVDADVLIDGRRVTGTVSQGQLFNTKLRGVSVDLPEVTDPGQRHILVQGRLDGPATDLDRLFHDTPLAQRLPAGLLDWRFRDGTVGGHLLLDMPLGGKSRQPMVIVDGRGDQVTLRNEPLNLSLTDVSAPVYFHLKRGINMRTLEGRALGARFQGSWLTRGPDSQMQLTGKVAVERLRDWLDADWMAPASGTLPLELDLAMPWGGNAFRLEGRSTLEGVKVDAPAPLGKAASQARTSRLVWRQRSGANQVSVFYGQIGEARFRLGDSLAGAVRLGGGELPEMPARGLTIEGRVARADAASWLDFVSGLTPAGAGQNGSGGEGGADARSLINRVSLSIDRLDLFGTELSSARFSAAPRGRDWELGLASPSVAGTVRLPEGYQARGDTPLSLTVNRLRLPDSPLGGGGDQGDGDGKPPLSPTRVPIMDVELHDLRLGGQALGAWSGRLRPVDGGVRVDALRGQWNHINVDGRLTWTEDGEGGQHSRYQGTLGSDDLKAAFSALDLPPLVETEDARATLDLAWNDWPLKPDYLALNGTATLDIGECRLPDPEGRTSLLRLLGVVNLANIQRRLRLDFSDVYQQGLACDGIDGEFRFDGPVLTAHELAIDSPSAAFEVNGEAQLAKHTLDLEVGMTLPLSSNLYAGCLAGPAVCAGIFVVERLWGDKLDKTTTMKYQVSGPWGEPKVKETEGFLE
ncbi:YhdP family protein [Alloalcanivorax sp. C16-2]|uniref:YhdP family protein n=1 Tax=Alloalcanivorax sp. C16-2 TaxID=3390052 RepID=UPI00397093BD